MNDESRKSPAAMPSAPALPTARSDSQPDPELNGDWEVFSAIPGDNLASSSVKERLRDELVESIRAQTEPPLWRVSAKVGIVHLFSAVLTLSICPQFGLRLVGDGHGLMAYFMALGPIGCYLLCGGFFIGTTVVGLGVVLNRAEWQGYEAHRPLLLMSLISLSLAGFMLAGGYTTLWIIAAWTVGSAFFGWILSWPASAFVRLRFAAGNA